MQNLATEIPFEYWNRLANQIITISSLLAGFSIAINASILVSKTETRLLKIIMVISTLAGSFFLITLFAMTKLLLMTTEGYPFKVLSSNLTFPRVIGTISFILGILSLITIISMAGWTKSKRMGIITTSLGVFTLMMILLMIT